MEHRRFLAHPGAHHPCAGVSMPRSREEIEKRIVKLKDEMMAAAKDLEFERAAEIRDEIVRLEAASLAEATSIAARRIMQTQAMA